MWMGNEVPSKKYWADRINRGGRTVAAKKEEYATDDLD